MDPISNTLGLNPMPTINISKDVAKKKLSSDDQFDEVQRNIREVTTLADQAIQELAGVAYNSQHPRAYEVLSTLMGQIVNANKTLLEIEKLKLEIEEKRNDPKEQNVTNNNLFVGSTTELLKKLTGDKDTDV